MAGIGTTYGGCPTSRSPRERRWGEGRDDGNGGRDDDAHAADRPELEYYDIVDDAGLDALDREPSANAAQLVADAANLLQKAQDDLKASCAAGVCDLNAYQQAVRDASAKLAQAAQLQGGGTTTTTGPPTSA